MTDVAPTASRSDARPVTFWPEGDALVAEQQALHQAQAHQLGARRGVQQPRDGTKVQLVGVRDTVHAAELIAGEDGGVVEVLARAVKTQIGALFTPGF